MNQSDISADILPNIHKEITKSFKELSDSAINRIKELTGDDNFFIDVTRFC
jgi:hypothetical protein